MAQCVKRRLDLSLSMASPRGLERKYGNCASCIFHCEAGGSMLDGPGAGDPPPCGSQSGSWARNPEERSHHIFLPLSHLALSFLSVYSCGFKTHIMLFRPATILLAAAICATRVIAGDHYDITFFTKPDWAGSYEYHDVEIGRKWPFDDRACGSCKDITKIPAGHLHSWSLGATCEVEVKFYGQTDCRDELKEKHTGIYANVASVHGDMLSARSFQACKV
ncbi:hypothetical protein BV22DRAFT_754697 [Leucogyrophana mollusca]|uniref:Uncharacterized protein n=1 Tax=Leucogyrophana mollusca TaxID=85980 RepID=A0ACB8B7B2_9AGAM|nr:hypothetical protein BV22DRAFT_754697 [Leucogyrophana mollusca]